MKEATENRTLFESSNHKNDNVLKVYTYDEVHGLRISLTTVVSISAALLLYVLVTFCYNLCKKNSQFGCKGSPLQTTTRRNATIVDVLIIIGAFTNFFYVGCCLLMLMPLHDPFCAIFLKVQITIYFISITSNYSALWYRVYSAIYAQRIVRQNIPKFMGRLNFVTLFLLALTFCANLVIFLLASYNTEEFGCVQQEEVPPLAHTLKYVILLVTRCAFQLLLLFTFIYPLYMHQCRMLGQGLDCHIMVTVSWRASVVAAALISSDLFTSLFSIAYKRKIIHPYMMVFGSNLTITTLGVIVSSVDWKKKLLPPCANDEEDFEA